jgi:hypothetical protein
MRFSPKYFLEDRSSEERFEQLCRSALHAERLDADRWREYTGVVLAEVEKRKDPRSEDPSVEKEMRGFEEGDGDPCDDEEVF